VQSWDTVNKATELSAFSVCTTWGVKGKDLFLLGLLRRRLQYPALKRAVRDQQSLFNESVGPGLGHPADLGSDRRGLPRCHALPADQRKDHAHARADCGD
jgi:hypothetical protein